MSAYFARSGYVYVADGPWEARLSQDQTDRLLTIWDDAGAVTLFNSLWEACQKAGYVTSGLGRKSSLRLVSPAAEVRRMFEAALADVLGGDPQPSKD